MNVVVVLFSTHKKVIPEEGKSGDPFFFFTPLVTVHLFFEDINCLFPQFVLCVHLCPEMNPLLFFVIVNFFKCSKSLLSTPFVFL